MGPLKEDTDLDKLKALGVWLAGLGINYSQKMETPEGREIMRRMNLLLEKTLVFLDKEIEENYETKEKGA